MAISRARGRDGSAFPELRGDYYVSDGQSSGSNRVVHKPSEPAPRNTITLAIPASPAVASHHHEPLSPAQTHTVNMLSSQTLLGLAVAGLAAAAPLTTKRDASGPTDGMISTLPGI